MCSGKVNSEGSIQSVAKTLLAKLSDKVTQVDAQKNQKTRDAKKRISSFFRYNENSKTPNTFFALAGSFEEAMLEELEDIDAEHIANFKALLEDARFSADFLEFLKSIAEGVPYTLLVQNGDNDNSTMVANWLAQTQSMFDTLVAIANKDSSNPVTMNFSQFAQQHIKVGIQASVVALPDHPLEVAKGPDGKPISTFYVSCYPGSPTFATSPKGLEQITAAFASGEVLAPNMVKKEKEDSSGFLHYTINPPHLGFLTRAGLYANEELNRLLLNFIKDYHALLLPKLDSRDKSDLAAQVQGLFENITQEEKEELFKNHSTLKDKFTKSQDELLRIAEDTILSFFVQAQSYVRQGIPAECIFLETMFADPVGHNMNSRMQPTWWFPEEPSQTLQNFLQDSTAKENFIARFNGAGDELSQNIAKNHSLLVNMLTGQGKGGKLRSADELILYNRWLDYLQYPNGRDNEPDPNGRYKVRQEVRYCAYSCLNNNSTTLQLNALQRQEVAGKVLTGGLVPKILCLDPKNQGAIFGCLARLPDDVNKFEKPFNWQANQDSTPEDFFASSQARQGVFVYTGFIKDEKGSPHPAFVNTGPEAQKNIEAALKSQKAKGRDVYAIEQAVAQQKLFEAFKRPGEPVFNIAILLMDKINQYKHLKDQLILPHVHDGGGVLREATARDPDTLQRISAPKRDMLKLLDEHMLDDVKFFNEEGEMIPGAMQVALIRWEELAQGLAFADKAAMEGKLGQKVGARQSPL